jgi:hypothetical protein
VRLLATRDSVAAGDDVDAPHLLEMDGPPGEDLEAAIAMVLRTGYLPSISGGRATWSVSSGTVLAVVAQEWAAPKMFWRMEPSYRGLDVVRGTLRLHFSYHAQHPPETVYEILRRLQLRADVDDSESR